MHVTTLGPLAIDGRPVRGERLAAVVRELVGARGHAVSVGALVDAVWDGEPPDDATGAVQALVSRVRRLGLDVRSVPGGYRLPADGLEVDADEARTLVGAARSALTHGDPTTAADLAARARALLPAAPDDPAAVHLLADAADAAARAALATGGPYDETDLRRLATRTPPDEPSVALLVRVLAAQGRDAEAHEVVEALRRELADRYGTDPSTVVRDVHLALLRGELGPTSVPTHPTSAAVEPDGTSGPSAEHDGLAVRTGTVRRAPATTRLPAAWRRPATPLLGRDDDVAAVTAALREAPVVTVVATGGAGKTRLAAEVARRTAEAGTSVHVVELAGLRSGDDVLPAVLGELGGPDATLDLATERAGLPRRERVRAAVAELSGLVVLDNCEHVLADAAAVVADLLDVVPADVAVLATSRAPLGLVGERVHRLRALPDADALALLRARAHAARPDLALDDEAAHALCHRLDNLPLAIELAAARLRSMPVQDLLDGLEDRFALLDDALRGLPERHASLWALVDWSHALLPADERALLQRLAVVPGSFPGALAASVADGDPADVRRGLADLVDQSLLVLDDAAGTARYRMLETVREYADARLAADGGRDAAMAGLVAWAAREAADLAPRMVGGGQLAAFARCADEQETLVASLRWALEHDDEAAAVRVAAALFQWWTVRGLHLEVAGWAGRLLHDDAPAARTRSPLFVGRAGAGTLPDGDSTTAVMLHSVVTGGVTGSLRLPALATRVVARVRREQADEVGARNTALAAALPVLTFDDPEAVERASDELARHPDEYVRALGIFMRAAMRENRGETVTSAQDARAAFALFEQIGDHWGMGMAAQGVAQWSATYGSPDAVTWLERGVHHLELVGAAQDASSLRVLLDVQRAVDGVADGLAALHDVVASPQAEPMDRAQAQLGLGLVALLHHDQRAAVDHARAAVRTVATSPTADAPQARIVFRVAAAVLLVQAGLEEPDAQRRAAIDTHVVEVLCSAADEVAETSDVPVIGSYALGAAELAAWRGDDETATELWALGTRLGANLASVALQLGQQRSLAGERAGEAGDVRLAELRTRTAGVVSRDAVTTTLAYLATPPHQPERTPPPEP